MCLISMARNHTNKGPFEEWVKPHLRGGNKVVCRMYLVLSVPPHVIPNSGVCHIDAWKVFVGK